MASVKCTFKGKDPNVWDKPWGAKLCWNGKELRFDFSSCQVSGLISEGPTVIIQAEPGSPVAFGQKEKRRGGQKMIAYAIVGEKLDLDYCQYGEALKMAKKWYYEYGVGGKLPYRKEEKKELQRVEDFIPKEEKEEEKQEPALKRERLAVLKVKSGIVIIGDPTYIYDAEEIGTTEKLPLLMKMGKEARDNAGSLKNKEYLDVAGFVFPDIDKKAAEITLTRNPETDEVLEVNIKFK